MVPNEGIERIASMIDEMERTARLRMKQAMSALDVSNATTLSDQLAEAKKIVEETACEDTIKSAWERRLNNLIIEAEATAANIVIRKLRYNFSIGGVPSGELS